MNFWNSALRLTSLFTLLWSINLYTTYAAVISDFAGRDYCQLGTLDHEEYHWNIVIRQTKESSGNCFTIFIDQDAETIGYIPVQVENGKLLFLGMYIDDSMRGKRLSTLFMGVYLKICEYLGLKIETGRMRKVLLIKSLVKFGFEPLGKVHHTVHIANTRFADGVHVFSKSSHLKKYFEKSESQTIVWDPSIAAGDNLETPWGVRFSPPMFLPDLLESSRLTFDMPKASS